MGSSAQLWSKVEEKKLMEVVKVMRGISKSLHSALLHTWQTHAKVMSVCF